MKLSKRINNLKPSATLVMAKKARELRASGENIISLSLGEPDFNTPDFISEAAIEAIKNNYNHYPPVGGYPELKDAIIHKLSRDNNLSYTKDEIIVSNGAKQSIYNLVQALIGKGDEVILPIPFWVSYQGIVELSEGTCKYIKTSIDTDFKITPDQLRETITEKSRLMIFSSPCNPSGSVYSKEELSGLAEVIAQHPNLIVVSDEIYEHIIFKGNMTSLASFNQIKDQVATVNGLSKGFAMTGWRVGYLAANKDIINACEKLQGQVTSGVNSIAQRAAITALEANPDKINYMVEAFKKRRDLVVGLAKELPGFEVNVPDGAFYIFPNVTGCFGKTYKGTKIKDANDLSLYLLEQAKVATVSGDAFGQPECIRISYATSEDLLIQAFKQIKEVLTEKA